MGSPIRAALYRAGVVASALLLGGFFGFYAFGLGLFAPAPVVGPLGFLITAAFSALGAAWAANALSPDRTRTRLLAVLGRCLVVGAVAAALDFAVLLATGDEGAGAALVIFGWLLLGLTAAVTSWALRVPEHPLHRDALITLAIALGAVLLVVGAVAMTCTITPCIA